jgi:ABC-2 type transport system permease protein
MPMPLGQFSFINSLRYMIDIAQCVYLEGVGLDRFGYDLRPLVAIAAITLSVSSWMFRHRVT